MTLPCLRKSPRVTSCSPVTGSFARAYAIALLGVPITSMWDVMASIQSTPYLIVAPAQRSAGIFCGDGSAGSLLRVDILEKPLSI